MKAVIISYSQTGRNAKLAQMVSQELGIDNIKIVEKNQRKLMTVAWDLVFNRVPKVQPDPREMDKYDIALLFTPVWMGAPATPTRAYLKHLKKSGQQYAFLSLCGGAGEKNPMLEGSIIKTVGRSPELLMEQHVSDLIGDDATREMTEKYNVSEAEYEMLCKKFAGAIREIL
ncbi:MAG: hypothetical protein AB1Z23_03570 [Eubacteriales bacterium]